MTGLQIFPFFIFAFVVVVADFNEIPLNQSVSQFAAKIYQELGKTNSDDNLLISPVSIQLIMGLLQTGATGITAQEFAHVLVLPENEKTLKEHLFKLRQSFIREDTTSPSKEPNVTIANAIYVRSDVKVSDSFYQTAKKYLNVDVRSLQNKFSNDTIVSQINKWVSRETNDQIRRVLDETSVTADTVMLLLNTLYFKGKWRESGFNQSETKPEGFYSNGRNFINLPMMHTSDYFLIGRYKTLNITYLELPYAGRNIDDTGDYVFAIYLPDVYENGIRHIRENIEQLLTHAPEITNVEQVDVRIPRFKVRSKHTLKTTLEVLGLRHAFANAQFSGLTADKKSVQVTDVLHSTALDVTEEGTEASAVTVIGIDDRIFSQPLPFVANRPFLFALKQKSTNLILFVGHFQNAKQEQH